ncbi:MAG: ABC transporter ATP-binding protein [Candidatus Pristimantibacillus lignocellulolyticus]|uniref:ABC transporter ATP-binding protein n=1 Tax=Candidatus Pristimantibacillus lignocellulolyticus TaxID=2994561 RepID=A0A9J6Z9H2_9BACL|nr:MAG: ABC transporter ATP-binding protein [Candidatus Pristimantibacillus lignocellulolyticus]
MITNLILRLIEVEKRYRQGQSEVIALHKSKLEIEEGEFVVIMGTSGSGKSTLLNIIGGMIAPTAGAVYLRDKKIKYDTKHSEQLSEYRRKEIGVVFQDYNLIEAMTVSENVAIPLILDGEAASFIIEKTESMLKQVGLEKRGSFRPYELSGGQQQRVALARALVKQPSILLADEPTGNLDYNTSKEILELLLEIKSNARQTIVMVTHDPMIAAYGERILFMQDGHVYEQLKLSEEMSSEQKIEKIVTAFYRMKGMSSSC